MPTGNTTLRALRTVSLGLALLLLTLVGHAYGRGDIPGIAGLLTCAALAFAIASAAAGRRLRPLPLLALILGSQVLLHLVLEVTAHHAPAPITSSMVVGHVAAGLVAAYVFLRGEEIAASWVAYLAQAIGAPELVLVRPTTLPRAATPDPTNHFASCTIEHIARRGPPSVRSTSP